METSSRDKFTALLTAIGPSGRERLPAELWRTYAKEHADHVWSDSLGNSFAQAQSRPGAARVVLSGHIDEIGVIVQSIDDEGLVWIDEVGGQDPQVLVSQPLVFLGREGFVKGVVGRKAIHLIESDELKVAANLKELWVDIGAKSREEAEKRLSVGDVGVVDTLPSMLNDTWICSRALDNRVGSFVVLEALRKLRELGGAPVTVFGVVTSMEELGLRGAVTIDSVNPDIAIAIDVTFDTTVGDCEVKQLGKHALGKGPVITRSTYHSPVVENWLIDAARRREIAHTIQASGSWTGTDGDQIAKSPRSIATAVVSVPLRYMHTPREVVDLQDVDAASDLLVEFILHLPTDIGELRRALVGR